MRKFLLRRLTNPNTGDRFKAEHLWGKLPELVTLEDDDPANPAETVQDEKVENDQEDTGTVVLSQATDASLESEGTVGRPAPLMYENPVYSGSDTEDNDGCDGAIRPEPKQNCDQPNGPGPRSAQCDIIDLSSDESVIEPETTGDNPAAGREDEASHFSKLERLNFMLTAVTEVNHGHLSWVIPQFKIERGLILFVLNWLLFFRSDTLGHTA